MPTWSYYKFEMYRIFTVQAYQTSQYVVLRGGIFLSKWRRSFAGSSDGKMNVQSACALNTRYISISSRYRQTYSPINAVVGFLKEFQSSSINQEHLT
jgi:hypothetical protein